MASGSARICLREGIEARDAVAIGQGRPGLALRTETDYLADGQVAQTRAYEGPLPSPTLIDTIDATYDLAGRPDQLKRSTSVLTDFTWNPDGTLASRTDGAIGTTAFQYDWADRLTRANLPDTFSTATPEFTWRADGLIRSRTYGAGTAVTFGYDSAKRLTDIAKGSLTLGQTYDRDGNVTSESRSLGFAGDAGGGTQTFTYDALNRVTGASGLGTSWTYTYDRNGNRKSKADGTTTLTYTYDRTDQLRTVGNGVLADAAFTYNAYGDLTSKVERASGGAWQTTTHSYDLAGKLTGLDGPVAGSGDAATFTFDALGRFKTRVLSGSTDTYSYLGTTETVLRINNSVGGITDSLVDSAGNRLAVKAGSTLNWFLPDPHGNVAAALSSNEATVVNALRYDPWGELAASGSGGGTAVGASDWKYQGRLDVAPAGTDAGALYDMGARFYSPSLGVFTQLDSVLGSAQDPRSMNRFLYAHANPATLIDPTGHIAMQACSSMADYCPDLNSGSLYDQTINQEARPDDDYVYPSSGGSAGGATGGSNTFIASAVPVIASYAGQIYAATAGWLHGIEDLLRGVGDASKPRCDVRDLDCTYDDFNSMSASARAEWLHQFQMTHETGGWFNALEDFIAIAGDRGMLDPSDFIGQVDAEILRSIQDGYAAFQIGARSTGRPGSDAFLAFFYARDERAPDVTLIGMHMDAEQAAVNYGIAHATAIPTHQERFLLGGADFWRALGRSRVFDHYGAGGLQSTFDPRSHAWPEVVDFYEDHGMFEAFGTVVQFGDGLNVLWPFD
jgi:RHS repeat-associated protein